MLKQKSGKLFNHSNLFHQLSHPFSRLLKKVEDYENDGYYDGFVDDPGDDMCGMFLDLDCSDGSDGEILECIVLPQITESKAAVRDLRFKTKAVYQIEFGFLFSFCSSVFPKNSTFVRHYIFND